jgi:hypothetical protein
VTRDEVNLSRLLAAIGDSGMASLGETAAEFDGEGDDVSLGFWGAKVG